MMAGLLIHSIFLTPSKGESAPHRSHLFSPGSAPFVMRAFGIPVWGALLPRAGRGWMDSTWVAPRRRPQSQCGQVQSSGVEMGALGSLPALLSPGKLPEAFAVVRWRVTGDGGGGRSSQEGS